MNIIYLLTNTSKKEGRRFYIGSKVECKIENLFGIPTIFDRNNKPYMGSSSCQTMKKDLENGDIFKASILQIVKNRKHVKNIEEEFLKSVDAASNEEYYNLTNYTLVSRAGVNYIINKYGETKDEFAASKSAVSKRVNRVRKLGFNSYEEYILYIHKKFSNSITMADISRSLGCKRHSASSTLTGINLNKCVEELNNITVEMKKAVYNCFLNGASLHKTCKLLNIELPTAIKLLGEYSPKIKTADRILTTKGITKQELTKLIIRNYMQGLHLKEISAKLKIDFRTTRKYFDYYVKKRLDINDI